MNSAVTHINKYLFIPSQYVENASYAEWSNLLPSLQPNMNKILCRIFTIVNYTWNGLSFYLGNKWVSEKCSGVSVTAGNIKTARPEELMLGPRADGSHGAIFCHLCWRPCSALVHAKSVPLTPELDSFRWDCFPWINKILIFVDKETKKILHREN